MKRKKRFYNSKHRSRKWTEEPVGRKIYFADKYIAEGEGESKFSPTGRTKKPVFTKANGERLLKWIITAAACLIFISVGYTVMDIHLEQNAMPYGEQVTSSNASLSSVDMKIKAYECQPLSLDGSIMLGAVIDTAFEGGYTCVAFDLKRNDGTIGYESRLATIEAYGAISSPSGDLAGSTAIMNENDILPIGVISCYKDNIAPIEDPSCAIFDDGSTYTDSGSNTYMNPDSDSTYAYIKSIVDEAMGMGVTVFALDNYNLPVDISDSYGDGYEALSQRLYDDIGEQIRIFRLVSINLTSSNAKALEKEWEEKTQGIKADDSTLLYLSSSDPAMLKQFLDNRAITNYIICE